MMIEKGARDEIRCVHGETGRVEFVKRYICESKNWQKSTGFVPQEIEPIVIKSETHVVEINEPNISDDSLDELVELNENGAVENAPGTKAKRKYNTKNR